MDEKLYRQIVAVIRRHSFQIKVEELRADYAYGDYPRGHRWFIPQSEIHREIRRMSRSDTEFMWRVRRCEVNRYDVEKIILGASHGVIRLHMV